MLVDCALVQEIKLLTVQVLILLSPVSGCSTTKMEEDSQMQLMGDSILTQADLSAIEEVQSR